MLLLQGTRVLSPSPTLGSSEPAVPAVPGGSDASGVRSLARGPQSVRLDLPSGGWGLRVWTRPRGQYMFGHTLQGAECVLEPTHRGVESVLGPAHWGGQSVCP